MAATNKQRRAAKVLQGDRGPELLAKVAEGIPLRDALLILGLPTDLQDELADRSEVQAARAQHRVALRRQIADPAKERRDAAQYLLEVDHGVRRPGTKPAEERFAAVLQRFAEKCPDGYRILHTLLAEAGELAK